MDVNNLFKEPKKQKNGRSVRVFMITFAVISAVGLLFFFRPETSETEKRKLAEFPNFTWDSFLSGDYFEGISTWYADTFPGRELLINLSHGIRNLFGIQDEMIIRDNPDDDAESQGTQDGTHGGTFDDTTSGEKLGGVYVKGITAYELYTESVSNSERYAELISEAARKLSGKATVYDMIVPLSSHVNLSSAEQTKIGNSDAQTAVNRMFSAMKNVKTVSILDKLISHNDEYLYFRTDHHWTATGAYYAYTEFCKSAGLTAASLDSFETREYSNFVGTLMAKAGKTVSDAGKDTVTCYLPKCDYDMVCYDKTTGAKYTNYGVVNKVTNASEADKYLAFLGGDHAYDVIRNNEKSDGSSICVVKESFGNAFVPFLVDHYEYVYVVDYRYFSGVTGKTLDAFVTENNIRNVLFINNLTATSVSARLNELSTLIGK